MRIALPLILAGAMVAADDPAQMWTTQVKPILDRACVECHGPKKAKHNLRVDSLEALLKGGSDMGPAVIAGKADDSPLVKVLLMPRSEDLAMPPEGKGDPLKPEEIAILKAWINALKK